jgi:hypothetical protein
VALDLAGTATTLAPYGLLGVRRWASAGAGACRCDCVSKQGWLEHCCCHNNDSSELDWRTLCEAVHEGHRPTPPVTAGGRAWCAGVWRVAGSRSSCPCRPAWLLAAWLNTVTCSGVRRWRRRAMHVRSCSSPRCASVCRASRWSSSVWVLSTTSAIGSVLSTPGLMCCHQVGLLAILRSAAAVAALTARHVATRHWLCSITVKAHEAADDSGMC